jgi:hypothetical protein
VGEHMTFHFCGYFPKKATPRPEDYDLPGVVEIASVSECIAEGPEDWIESWKFHEHSPLSCNGEARTFKANTHCLFDALDDAVAAAEIFSKEEPEPGPYYVVRVLRRQRTAAE